MKLFFQTLRDFILLCAILAGVNWLLARTDPGWLALNPTPWLLPAALIGARYGFTAGLLCGLGAAALVAGAHSRLQDVPLQGLLHDHPFFFLSIVVGGAVSGEISRLLTQRNATLVQDNARLADETARLRAQLQVVDETRHQLQQQLALYNAPMCALDEELARLFTHPQEEFGNQLLRTLHRLTGLTSAGIYVVDHGTLRQTSVLHATPPLQAALQLHATPLAEKAIRSGALASVADALELSAAQPFLAAFPWLDHLGRTSVLLIQDMPLESYTLQNLARLELILSWASAMAVLRHTFTAGAGADHTVSNDDFLVLLSEALDAEQVHSLPSAVLRFPLPPGTDLRRVLGVLPDTAVATRLRTEQALAVLLPFSGEPEALQANKGLAAALPGMRPQHYLITGGIPVEELWATLQKP